MQNWYKAKSVFIYSRLMELLERFDPGMKEPHYWEVIEANSIKKGANVFQRGKILWQNGKSGVIVQIVMLLFGIAQIYFVCSI